MLSYGSTYYANNFARKIHFKIFTDLNYTSMKKFSLDGHFLDKRNFKPNDVWLKKSTDKKSFLELE